MAWSHFAFGAVYDWASPPLLILALAACTAARALPEPRRITDAALFAALFVVVLQLIPLPSAVHRAIAPASLEYRAAMQLGAHDTQWQPLSLDPGATGLTLIAIGAAAGLFLAARRVAGGHGRSLAAWIGWMAMVAALLGIGDATLFPGGLVYGFWKPTQSGAAPFGAIINRNHYAAWAIVAGALAAGGLVAHVVRRHEHVAARRRLVTALSDTRALWLLVAVALAGASIVVTASRAGSIGLVAATIALAAIGWRRARGRAIVAFAAVAVVCLTAVALWARPDRLFARLGEGGVGLRSEIWRETSQVAARYPITGVGAGAFPAAMTAYQTRRDVFYNHAHNQYLEIAAEGGLLLSIPLLVVIAGIAGSGIRGLEADRGSYVWVRAGACAGLAGMAVLAIWESPFHTPATLMITAVAAGLAAAPPRR